MVPAMRSPVSRRIPRLATSRQVAMVGRKRPYATKPDSAEPAPPLPHRPAEHQAQAQTHETSSLPMAEQRQPKTSVGSGTFYRSFGSPILKCFLGALFTYQIIYWSWMKLESLEVKRNLEEEIRIEERKLVGLVKAKEGNGKLAR